MIRSRFFGMLVDPRQYRRGYSVRGWWLNVINHVRVWLEKRVALHMLVCEGFRRGIPRETLKLAVKQAKRDPHFVPNFDPEDPKRQPRVLLRDRFPALFGAREDRYKAGRNNSEYDSQHERPIPIEEGMRVTLAVYERRNDRSMRYQGGRQPIVIIDGDGIEAVKGAGNVQSEFDPNRSVAERRRRLRDAADRIRKATETAAKK